MSANLVAKATTSIGATAERVWEALVTPEAIKQYMFGADVESDWKEGSAITWEGQINDTPFADKGVILKIDPGKMLQYSHYSPMSGKPDVSENYHTVTIKLDGGEDSSEVTLTQDNNANEKARDESEHNWQLMLAGLKRYVEESTSIAI